MPFVTLSTRKINYKQTVNDVMTNDWKADNKSLCKSRNLNFVILIIIKRLAFISFVLRELEEFVLLVYIY